MRSGTLNVPGIVGLGKACEIAREDMAKEGAHLAALRDRLRDRIMGPPRRGLHQWLDGAPSARQPEHQLRLRRRRIAPDGHQRRRRFERIGLHLCDAGTSYVLKALGTGDDLAHSSIRFGIGRFNNEAEVDYVADRVCETVERLRELSPLYEMAKEGIDLKKM